jgi:Acetyltransferase (GNAT) domain
VRAVPIPINWHSDLSIYASEPFLRTMSQEYGWLGGLDAFDTLRCVLPYAVIHKSVFRLVRFPVQTIPLGADLRIDDERAFLNGAATFFRGIKADVIIPATFNTLFRAYPDDSVAVPYGSYVVSLDRTEEALWGDLHPKHRNKVRHAQRSGVTIRMGLEHLETAYRLVVDSFLRSAPGVVARARVRSRLDYRTVHDQARALGEHVRVLIAECDGVAQSSAIIPFSTHSAYYMHGGTVLDPVTGASNLLQWEAMRHFRDLGVRRYDLVGARIDPPRGSKAEGLVQFKERFGGVLVRGYMWKLALRPLKTRLYSLAALVRNGGDVVDQETHRLQPAHRSRRPA